MGQFSLSELTNNPTTAKLSSGDPYSYERISVPYRMSSTVSKPQIEMIIWFDEIAPPIVLTAKNLLTIGIPFRTLSSRLDSVILYHCSGDFVRHLASSHRLNSLIGQSSGLWTKSVVSTLQIPFRSKLRVAWAEFLFPLILNTLFEASTSLSFSSPQTMRMVLITFYAPFVGPPRIDIAKKYTNLEKGLSRLMVIKFGSYMPLVWTPGFLSSLITESFSKKLGGPFVFITSSYTKAWFYGFSQKSSFPVPFHTKSSWWFIVKGVVLVSVNTILKGIVSLRGFKMPSVFGFAAIYTFNSCGEKQSAGFPLALIH